MIRMAVPVVCALLLVAACSGGGDMPPGGYKPDGKMIFNNGAKGACINCHRVDERKFVGPGLAGTGTLHTRDWLDKWLTDPQAVWEANDAETQDLKRRVNADNRKYTGMKMPRPLDVNEREALVNYLMTL